jgi:hypothetical protein
LLSQRKDIGKKKAYLRELEAFANAKKELEKLLKDRTDVDQNIA